MYDLPSMLQNHIHNAYGERGEKWLADLPKTLNQLAGKWQLSDFSPVDEMSWHYVTKAKSAQFGLVVLKLGCDKVVMQEELNAYQHFQHHGLLKLFSHDDAINALLMQQALPGHSMHAVYLSDIDGCIQAYGQLLERLKQAPQSRQMPNKTLNDWLKAIKKTNPASLPNGYIKKALFLIEKYQSIDNETYVIHGDLHQENALCHGGNWVAIDPKGIVGHKLFEAASFDYVHASELSVTDIKTIFNHRIESMAKTLNLDAGSLRHWIFIRLILASCWMVEDKGDPGPFLQYISPLFGDSLEAI